MITERRGKHAAVIGAVCQLVFTAVMLTMWLWTDSLSALPVMLFLAGGVLLWLVVAVQFYCRQLARQEEMELADLAADGAGAGTIFEQTDEAELQAAANRLALFERRVVPVFTLVWASCQAVIGIFVLRWLADRTAAAPSRAAEGALFCLLVAFVAFLLSRYMTGMGSQAEWRPLRPAGSYLLVCAAFVAATGGALLAANRRYEAVDLWLAHVIPIVQLLLAAELIVNFVLEMYRPRVPGQEERASYDSRLFNLLAEPQRVGHSIAETLNYQFGFEVSKTWFYRLLSRALAPLIVFGVVVMIALTSIVYVRQGRRYVVMRWGRVDESRGALKPGLRFKLPWPIETARGFDTTKLHDLLLGVEEEEQQDEDSDSQAEAGKRKVVLWTQDHARFGRMEGDFLIAIKPRDELTRGRGGLPATAPATRPDDERAKPPPAVNIVKLVVLVRYRIRNVYRFGFDVADGHRLLECLASREMIRYCSSATLFEKVSESDEARPQALMTTGVGPASIQLRKRIQAAVDQIDLGVEIADVGFVSVHPPQEAAEAFESVLEAERQREVQRSEAMGQSDRELVAAAGDPKMALLLALEIRKHDELANLARKTDPRAFADEVEKLSVSIDGDIERLDKEIARGRLEGRARGVSRAEGLRAAYLAYKQLLAARNPDDRAGLQKAAEAAAARADDMLAQSTGAAAVKIAEARASAVRKRLTDGAKAMWFDREALPYQAAPDLYMLDRLLAAWEAVLPNAPKYIIAVDPNRIESWLDYERAERSQFATSSFDEQKDRKPEK